MDTDDLGARPWLLLPGTLCTGTVFDVFLDCLAVPRDRRHVVCLDRPDIDSYGSVFEASTADTVVCGFSLGAIVAAHFADRLKAHSLILFGLNPHADDPAKAQGRHDLAKDVAASGGATALRRRPVAVFGPAAHQALQMIHHMADETAGLIDAQTRLALTRPGALPALAKARIPMLALTGSVDQSAPPPQAMAAAAAAPLGQFRSLDGLGHFALLEDPVACARAVTQLAGRRHDTD